MNFIDIARESKLERYGQQRVDELAAVLKFLSLYDIRRVVEIGVHDAGTLWAWGQLTPQDESSQVIGVDLTEENIRDRNLTDLSPRDTTIILGPSDSPATLREVNDYLMGPIDFLFIDGDHYRAQVESDYLVWRDRVRPGGVIGFHDTLVAGREGWNDVLARHQGLSVEFCQRDDDLEQMGIGLLLV